MGFTCMGLLAGPWDHIVFGGGSKHDRARRDLRGLEEAFRLYFRRTGRLPPEGAWPVLVDEGTLESDPVDPWGNPYHFTIDDGLVRLWSRGADGQEGGEGSDADVVHTFDVGPPPP
jgi:general secretion pathway protein G